MRNFTLVSAASVILVVILLGFFMQRSAEQEIRALPRGLISGSDIDQGAVRAARENAKQLPHGENITFKVKNVAQLPPLEKYVIICNPPYGVRLKKHGDTNRLLTNFTKYCKEKGKDSTLCIFLGKKELAKSIGLRPSAKKEIRTGGLDGILLRYEIFGESREI